MIRVYTRFYPRKRTLEPFPPLLSDFRQIAYHLHTAALSKSPFVNIPVSSPESWKNLQSRIEELFRWLVSTRLQIRFYPMKRLPSQYQLSVPEKYARVALFSGGLDSGAYSILLSRGREDAILSHTFSSKNIFGKAKKFYKRFAPKNNQLVVCSARLDLHEGPTNTRGLVFLANALTTASYMRVPVVDVPENGPMMINPTVSVRAVATKTTNQGMITRWTSIFNEATGSKMNVFAPFADKTKAEIVVALNSPKALANTYSCFTARGQKLMCGLCFACVVRRLSCLAAGMPEPERFYKYDWLVQNQMGLRSVDKLKLDIVSDAFRFWAKLADPASIQVYEERREAETLITNYPVLKRHSLDMLVGIDAALRQKGNLGVAGLTASLLLQKFDRNRLNQRKEELLKSANRFRTAI